MIFLLYFTRLPSLVKYIYITFSLIDNILVDRLYFCQCTLFSSSQTTAKNCVDREKLSLPRKIESAEKNSVNQGKFSQPRKIESTEKNWVNCEIETTAKKTHRSWYNFFLQFYFLTYFTLFYCSTSLNGFGYRFHSFKAYANMSEIHQIEKYLFRGVSKSFGTSMTFFFGSVSSPILLFFLLIYGFNPVPIYSFKVLRVMGQTIQNMLEIRQIEK